VIVYDLGGGTFDTAAVSLEGRRFELVASEGVARLGGDDFDQVILELALREQEAGTFPLDGGKLVRALDLCREAKEGLRPSSRRLLVDLSPVLPDFQPVILDVGEIYERCQPLVDQTIGQLELVFDRLANQGIDPSSQRELGAIYLVGGGSAFPTVPRALRAMRGRKIQLAPQPHAATAVGLAIAADPEAQIFVREGATRHFGVWREALSGSEQVFDCIVSKNQSLDFNRPIVVERCYRPRHTVGQLRFLECSRLTPDGQPTGELTPWCDVYFPYDASLMNESDLAAHTPTRMWVEGDEIVETYTYSGDGRLAVDIQNRTRGYDREFLLGQLR
jgi:hypothetical protein